MWCHSLIVNAANATRISGSSARRGLRAAVAGLAIAAIGVAATAPVASADSSAMSIAFPSRAASVAGPGALVSVKCAGVSGRECAGTLTLKGLTENHQVSYSVVSGEKRTLVVPLGSERKIFAGVASPSMRVVAETMQPTGYSVKTTRVLRFK
jgi:hypothetical protein